jgi:hypothetical protein
MKYPETHLGHSYGASVPSSEEMGLFKKDEKPSLPTTIPVPPTEKILISRFERWYSNLSYVGATKETLFKDWMWDELLRLEGIITELQKTEFNEI